MVIIISVFLPALYFPEDVGVIDMVLDGVGDGVVASQIVEFESGFPFFFGSLVFDLSDHLVPESRFVIFFILTFGKFGL